MRTKQVSFEKLASSIWSCFPIIPKTNINYVKPFRQYKDLSDKVEVNIIDGNGVTKYVYWTTIPAMFLCALSDIFGHKDKCLDFLGMGVTKHEGHAEYARYVNHYNILVDYITLKPEFDLSEGERAFIRKIKIVRNKIKNIKDAESMFKYD